MANPLKVWKFRSMKVMENDKAVHPGDAERSARHQKAEASAPHLAG
ncbi:hypothetical protein ACNKHV_12935 [Shigella flexneri]